MQFRPYRNNIVEPHYRKVMLPGFTKLVWAKIEPHSDVVNYELGEEYRIEILGQGEQPFISWKDVCTDSKRELLLSRSMYIDHYKGLSTGTVRSEGAN
jgi:hypothetical protein